MIVYEHAVRFEEVDVAGIVFFPRYANIAHQAVERFFAGLDGGYAGLVNQRKIGLPVVHLDIDYRFPLRYGDTALVETSCRSIGRTSAVLGAEFRHAGTSASLATVVLTVVSASLAEMKRCPMPDDVRALLGAHLVSV